MLSRVSSDLSTYSDVSTASDEDALSSYEMSDDLEDGTSSDNSGSISPDNLSSSAAAAFVKRTILVTGAAGFIGSATAYHLLERGDDVVIIDELNDYYSLAQKRGNINRLVSEFGEERCRVYIGDICDQALIDTIFQNHPVDSIIHLAARAGVRPSIDDPFIYVHSNVKGQTTLLEACRKYDIQTFVYASSSSVYGGSKKELFSENDVVDKPCSQYAATKKSCELLAATYNNLYGINTSGLRFFTVYGPNGRPDMAPFKFVDRVFRGVPMDQYGDGTSERDYTYITDIVQGVILAVDKPCGCEVFNIGRGTPTSLKTFISLVEKYVGKKAIINYLPDQPGDVPRTCADISHTQRMLGYKPTTSFEDGLKKTVEWYIETFGNKTDADRLPELLPGIIAPHLHNLPENTFPGLTVGTRIHSIKDSEMKSTMETLQRFLDRTVEFAERVSIAVGCSLEDKSNLLLSSVREVAAEFGDQVSIIPVLNWTGFTPALNALLADATTAGSTSIMFASLEMIVDSASTSCLLSELTKETLVVGARLPGHSFLEGNKCVLDGTTTPWNTLAVWSVKKLSLTGFLSVADGLGKKGAAGVEEVSVIALHQRMSPNISKAKVVRVPGIEWQTNWNDSERIENHRKKMESKFTRANEQQKLMAIESGTVLHV